MGTHTSGDDIVNYSHECLNLCFPGASEFQWQLLTKKGPKRNFVSEHYGSDEENVLTDRALAEHGIVLKPIFEIIDHLKADRLVQVAKNTPPVAGHMACLFFPHRRRQNAKTRLFMEFMIERVG